jgi:hypothetical protein
MEKLTFVTDDGEETEFEIIADTRLRGVNYLLVYSTDEEDALILKDISEESEKESRYVFVDDEAELAAVAGVFEEDLDLTIE